MQQINNKIIARILFLIATIILVLFPFMELNKIPPISNEGTYASMALVGIVILGVAILFWGRSRIEQKTVSKNGVAAEKEPISRSIVNFLLFLIDLAAFLFLGVLYSFSGFGESSTTASLAGWFAFFCMLVGLFGLVAVLLGKRKIALVSALIMAIPFFLSGFSTV